ncbi:ATP-binding protein [Bacillus wiedmannii]|uniref:ATP-binding protein n=1 Tax=Bacillus wiedmannii TaxID=1890302 RepID=UPI000BEF502E|nr:ATP-binding protein [Bacillus wiedmannii]PEM10787.1 ATP-binding protein [Bacillus wiedmannii]
MDEKKEENLPNQEQKFYYPALYLGGVPAEIPKKKKKWWKRTETIAWSDFFQIEQNKMVVYRIIPHSNVTNNTRRLWKAIYKMYEMYEAPGTRLKRDGLRFVYREKDLFWFDVIFKQEDGQKKIEFYVSTSEYQAIKLKRKLENKMNVTIKEVSLEQIQVPEENTIVQELKYLKHDIFSLNTNANEQKTPIAAVLNTIDELQFDGDFARLSICNEAENRQKWIKNASWAYEKLSKGKVPQRATINSRMVLGASKQALGGFVNEVNFLITDLFNALANTFFKSNKSYEKGKVVDKPFSLEDEINSRHISNASREKLNNPVFKSHIRIAAHSQDRLTRETISETLSLAYSEIADNNEIHGVKINVKSRKKEVLRELNTLHLSSRTKMNGNVNLISTDEMAKLAMQMPTAELQRRYEEALSVKKRTETDIPSVLQDPKNLLIGYAEHKDKKINVGLQADQKEEFYCGYTFIGKQGSGKDNSIQNFVYEGAMKHNISFVIPDWICQPGHKGMADGIRDLLPPEKIIDLDLSNEEHIIPMDLTEVIKKLGRKGGSRFALEMVDFMNLEGLARSEKYLMEAAKASNGSLYNIKKIIEDEDYRVDRISELLEEGYERLAKELLQWGDNNELSNKCDAILSRLNMFFGEDTLHDIFAQDPKENVNFEKWMKEGKVIIIRMPKRKLGAASNILAHWVTLKVLMTRMLMSEEDKDRHGCFLIFNEPEQVESKGLSKLMGRIATEGRKERLGSIFAFHHWGKLPDYLRDNLIAGGVNQFLFANDHKGTFELAKERLHPTFTIEDALRTPKHYSIAILNTKEPLHAFMVHMLPPIDEKERFDNSLLTIQHAKLYGRKWEELQK